MKFRDPPPFLGQILLDEKLQSDYNIKTPLIERIFEILKKHHVELQEERMMKVRLCLDEALMNAILHGNKQNNEKRVIAQVLLNTSSWCVEIADEGEGFSSENIPDINNEESWMMESGRGILLIESFTDDVFFYEGGRRLRMVYLR